MYLPKHFRATGLVNYFPIILHTCQGFRISDLTQPPPALQPFLASAVIPREGLAPSGWNSSPLCVVLGATLPGNNIGAVTKWQE